RPAAAVHALVRHRRRVEGPDHRPRLLLPDLHQCLLRPKGNADHPGLVGPQHGRKPLAHLLDRGRPERAAADLSRRAGVARPLLQRVARHRHDQWPLGFRPPDPRRGKQPPLRPDVRLAAQHRDPRLPRRPAAGLRASPPALLAGGAGVRWLRPLALVGALALVWELAARSGLWSPLIFPSLASIARELGWFVVRPEWLMEAWTSLYRALAGFALAATAGVLLGLLMGRSSLVARLLDPLFSGTYAVPKIALFPIFIFVFGIGSLSKVALVFLECLYPIVIMTSHGARDVNRVLLWSGQNMGASRAQLIRRVVLPATAPYIFAGFRVALPVALIVVVITEMVNS